jgi:hypothetical protein
LLFTGQANLLLACKAFGVETVMDALLVCAQHKAKQKAVPALESVNLLITSFGLKVKLVRFQVFPIKTHTYTSMQSHSTSAPKTAHVIKSTGHPDLRR